jgi:hypothetical protein
MSIEKRTPSKDGVEEDIETKEFLENEIERSSREIERLEIEIEISPANEQMRKENLDRAMKRVISKGTYTDKDIKEIVKEGNQIFIIRKNRKHDKLELAEAKHRKAEMLLGLKKIEEQMKKRGYAVQYRTSEN